MSAGNSLARQQRWSAIGLVIGGAIAFETVLQLAWEPWKSLPYHLSPLMFERLTVVLLTILALYLAAEPIRIRREQWKRVVDYPPIWSAALGAFIVVAVIDGVRQLLGSETLNPEWVYPETVILPLMAIAIAFALRQLPREEAKAENLCARLIPSTGRQSRNGSKSKLRSSMTSQISSGIGRSRID